MVFCASIILLTPIGTATIHPPNKPLGMTTRANRDNFILLFIFFKGRGQLGDVTIVDIEVL